jgi:putative transcriptional regulator
MSYSCSTTDVVTEMNPSISNNIRKLRFENNEMSQQALADAVGVTRQTVFAIEKSKYSPSLEVAFKIADVFSVGLDDVFTYHRDQ